MRRQRSTVGSVPSWRGDGSLELTGKERFGLHDLVVVLVAVAAVDLTAFVIAVFVSDRSSHIACGVQHCYPDPHPVIHDAHMYLWITGITAAVAIGAVLAFRRARIAVIVLQLIGVGIVLAFVLPSLSKAQTQLQHLEQCNYGAHPPCVGVRQLT